MKRRILVAEDDAQRRSAVSEFLRGEGFDVVEAQNGAAGLEAARTDAPDVLVLDLNMPQVDGSAVLEQWTASPRLRDIPVLLVSAGPKLAENAQRFEVRASLAKPFDMDVLGTVIEQLAAHPEPPPDTAGGLAETASGYLARVEQRRSDLPLQSWGEWARPTPL